MQQLRDNERAHPRSLIEREKLVLAALPELSLKIVEFAREHGRVTMADAMRPCRSGPAHWRLPTRIKRPCASASDWEVMINAM